MKSTFSVIYYLKRQVVKKDGTVPVMGRMLQADRRSETVGHQRGTCHGQKHGGSRSEPYA